AFHVDLAAIQMREPLTDRQAEPSTAVLERDIRGRLGKLLENIVQPVGCDADPRILHAEAQGGAVGAQILELKRQRYRPALSKLERIACEIYEDLPDPQRVTDQTGWHPRVDHHAKRE